VVVQAWASMSQEQALRPLGAYLSLVQGALFAEQFADSWAFRQWERSRSSPSCSGSILNRICSQH
jgi:hypothetical protein